MYPLPPNIFGGKGLYYCSCTSTNKFFSLVNYYYVYNSVLFTRSLYSVTFPLGFRVEPFGAREQCAMTIGLELESVDPFYRLKILSWFVMCLRKCTYAYIMRKRMNSYK